MSRQLVFPTLTKIQSNGIDTNDEILKVVNKAIQENDVMIFKDIVEKENLTFPREIYCDIVKHKALKIFHYLFVEMRTKDEQKNLDLCYKNIQNPDDAGNCSKRNSNAKQIIKTFNMDDWCSCPQTVFLIAMLDDDKRILQFIIACGIPIDIETYSNSRKYNNGKCSFLYMALQRGCNPNKKKMESILYSV